MKPPLYLQSAIEKVKEQAIACPEEEVCGLIIDGVVHPAKNVAFGIKSMPDGTRREASPKDDFELDDKSFQLWANSVGGDKKVVIYHSHVNENDDFTPSDVENMYATACPWLMVHVPSERIRYFDPHQQQPYEGRPWHYAYSNCFTLVRDWLKRELNFTLVGPVLQREHAWEDKMWNEIVEGCDRQMERLPRDFGKLQRGDVLVFRVGERAFNPNHMGVMVSSEKNLFLHQLIDRPSAIKDFTSAYRKSVYYCYRPPTP